MPESIFLENPESTNQIPNYPIECLHSINPIKDTTSLLHWHFCCEMVFVYRGRELVNIGGKTLVLNPGDIIYIHPQQVHEFVNGADCSEIVLLKFDTSLLLSQKVFDIEQDYWSPFLTESGYRCLTFKHALSDVQPYLDLLLSETETRSHGFQLRMRHAICMLMSVLCDTLTPFPSIVPGNMLSKKETKQFNMLLQYIATHFYEDSLIDTALEFCHLSYSNFAVKFKRLYGKTFTDYVNHVRISYAQHMLTNTNEPMAIISEACGYHDPCYFSRIFRKLTGTTPLSYRQAHTNK